MCCVLSPPVHPGGAPHQQVPVQPGGPAAPVPGGGVWPACQQPSPHQAASMSPIHLCHSHTHTLGHRLYSNIVNLIGSADEVFPGLQVRRGPLSHSGCCLQVQE